jgi:hypothetical protein
VLRIATAGNASRWREVDESCLKSTARLPTQALARDLNDVSARKGNRFEIFITQETR